MWLAVSSMQRADQTTENKPDELASTNETGRNARKLRNFGLTRDQGMDQATANQHQKSAKQQCGN